MQQLIIPRPLATKLLFEAQKKPDEEVCGLVGASDGQACSLYPIANVAQQRETRFRMDEAQQIAAMKTLRERGETLLAIYHSHPHSPPEPSARDLDELGHPEAVYLIISLNIKGVLEMRGWQRTADGVRPVELKVME